MVAVIGIPGSKDFRYFVGTKKECETWLKDTQLYKWDAGHACFSMVLYRLVSNKEASKWRYRDGTKVITF